MIGVARQKTATALLDAAEQEIEIKDAAAK